MDTTNRTQADPYLTQARHDLVAAANQLDAAQAQISAAADYLPTIIDDVGDPIAASRAKIVEAMGWLW